MNADVSAVASGRPIHGEATASQRELSNARLAAFASPEAPYVGLITPVVVFLPPFYATDRGLPLATVSMVFLVARLWDVVLDPAFGYWSDRIYTRFGRRRPWIVLAVPVIALAVWPTFWPAAGLSAVGLLFWLLVLYTGFTFGNLSHFAWAAELSGSYRERTRIMGWLQAAQMAGAVLITALPAVLQSVYDAPTGVQISAMGVALWVLLPITAVGALSAVPEPPAGPVRALEPQVGFFSLFRNRLLLRLLLADLLAGLAIGFVASMFVFLVRHAFALPRLPGALYLFYLICGTASLPAWVFLARRVGKHRAFSIAMCVMAAAGVIVALVPPGSVASAACALALLGPCYGAGAFLPRAILADVVDKDELETGSARAGAMYAVLTMTMKIGLALAIPLGFALLERVDFQPTGPNSGLNADRVAGLFAVVLPVLTLSAAALMWRFPLTEAEQQRVRREIAARR